MGGAKSKNITNVGVVSKAVSEAITKNIMDCGIMVNADQTLSVTGNYNVLSDIKMKQVFNINVSCANSAQNIAKLQTDIANAVQQNASTQTQSLLGALNQFQGGSSLKTEIQNDIRNTITNENITNMATSLNQQQGIIIRGNNNIVKNVQMEQMSDLVLAAAQQMTNSMQSLTKVENTTAQVSTYSESNFISGIVDSIFGGLTGLSLVAMVIFVVLIIALVVGIIAFKGDIIELAKYLPFLYPFVILFSDSDEDKREDSMKAADKVFDKKQSEIKENSDNQIETGVDE
jgi:hypothetical protein